MTGKAAKRKVRAAREALYRQLILEASEGVFAARGYEDTKMEQIAQASGVSLQTVYSVFPGKAEIFRALHEQGDRALLDRSLQAARDLSDPLEALMAGVRAYTLYFMEHPEFLAMHLHEGLNWGGEGAGAGNRERTEAWREGVESITIAFQRCIDQGLVVPGDARLMARMMIAMQQVQLAAWLEGDRKQDPDGLVGAMQDQIRRSFALPSALEPESR